MPIWFKAALAQAIAVVLVWGLVLLATPHGVAVPISMLPWIQGGLAGILGAFFRLPMWWWPIQLLFLPGLILAMNLDLPPFVFLIGLILLMLVFPSNLRERVPLYLSNRATWLAVAGMCPPDRPFVLLDLGCGTGGGLDRLAAVYPQGRFVGVETAPVPYLLAWLRLLRRKNAEVRLANLWSERLSHYDVVYAFLSPSPMPRLWEKVYAEMKAGSVFVSNSFEVPGVTPSEIVEVDDARRTRLLIWRF